MKKLMTMLIGLSLVLGTVTAFGADTATKKKATATKAPKKKSTVKKS
jgi:hypothetical protein